MAKLLLIGLGFISAFSARAFATVLDCSSPTSLLRGNETHWSGGAQPPPGSPAGSQTWTFGSETIGEAHYFIEQPEQVLVPLEVTFNEKTKIVLESEGTPPCEPHSSTYAIQVTVRKPDGAPLCTSSPIKSFTTFVVCKLSSPGCPP